MPRESFALRVPIVSHSNGAKATRMGYYYANRSALGVTPQTRFDVIADTGSRLVSQETARFVPAACQNGTETAVIER
jgi:hypothetical protein